VFEILEINLDDIKKTRDRLNYRLLR